jgi:hypothetical protein
MSRRPFLLAAVSLVALTLAACSDITAPTQPTAGPKPTAQGAQGSAGTNGGYLDSTGRR